MLLFGLKCPSFSGAHQYISYVSRWRQQCAMVKEAERVAGGRPLDAVVPDEPAAEEI